MLRRLSEKTLIPISLAFALFGGVAWLTSLHAETKANGGDILEMKDQMKHDMRKLDIILEKLGRIEGYLSK